MENVIVNDIRRGFLIQALKQSIRAIFHPLVAEKYCQQIDDVTHFAKWLEAIRKSKMS